MVSARQFLEQCEKAAAFALIGFASDGAVSAERRMRHGHTGEGKAIGVGPSARWMLFLIYTVPGMVPGYKSYMYIYKVDGAEDARDRMIY